MNWVEDKFVFIDLDASSSEESIRKMSKFLREAGYVKASFEDAVLSREEMFPTGLPTPEIGVAIPHTDPEHVIHPTIAIAILKKPVEFKQMGYPEISVLVKVVCMLVFHQTRYVELLSQLVEIIQDSEFLKNICSEKNPSTISNLFNSRLSLLMKEEIEP